jgi:hypothetical protein
MKPCRACYTEMPRRREKSDRARAQRAARDRRRSAASRRRDAALLKAGQCRPIEGHEFRSVRGSLFIRSQPGLQFKEKYLGQHFGLLA